MRRIIIAAACLAGCLDLTGPPPTPAAHRAEAEVCEPGRDTWEVPTDAVSPYNKSYTECESHEECADGEDGRCTLISDRVGPYLACTYNDCLTDADCGGSVCACDFGEPGANHVCLPEGNCQTDDDCGEDYCSLSVTSCGPGWGYLGYFCHTASDQCRDDSDCGNSDDYCAFDEEEARWTCSSDVCVG